MVISSLVLWTLIMMFPLTGSKMVVPASPPMSIEPAAVPVATSMTVSTWTCSFETYAFPCAGS